MRKYVILIGLLLVFLGLTYASSSQAAYLCGTPYGDVTVNDFPCTPASHIVDHLFSIYSNDSVVSFAQDGYFVYCYKNPGYIVCVPHPASPNAWILLYY